MAPTFVNNSKGPPGERSKKLASLLKTRQAALQAVKDDFEATTGGSRVKGKVGIITGVGPSTGIGTATTKLLAREGASHLYLLDYVDTELKPLVEALQKTFPNTKFTPVKADAADDAAIKSVVEQALKEQGRLDFFFSNAGIIQNKPKGFVSTGSPATDHLKLLGRTLDQIPADDFTEVMRINALSAFLAVKYAAPAIAQANPARGKTVPGGSIILTASVAGIGANAGPVPYSASKAAVRSIAQTSAYELAGQNVRVNCICPGLIQTDMTKGLFDAAEAHGKTDMIGLINPMMRQGIGHEVGRMALFLASDESSYVNGQSLVVDGGLTASMPYVRPRL